MWCDCIMMSSVIDCDIISSTYTELVRHKVDVWGSYFYLQMGLLCHVRNRIIYVQLWQTVHAHTRVLFWCLFPELLRNSGNKHQNNTLVSASAVRHSSTYIIHYISHEICTWLYCTWFCFVYIIVPCKSSWCIYPYPSGLESNPEEYWYSWLR